jgi:hypothetical protein
VHDFDEAHLTKTLTGATDLDRTAHDAVRAGEEAPAEEPHEDRRQHNEDRDADGEVANAKQDL